MRVWHQNLIPKLCRQHLLACWRESLGAYKIITENKKGYRNHPAVKEFLGNPLALWARLYHIREEMLRRGYKPKELPELKSVDGYFFTLDFYEWQSLNEQIEVLRSKGCDCKI